MGSKSSRDDYLVTSTRIVQSQQHPHLRRLSVPRSLIILVLLLVVVALGMNSLSNMQKPVPSMRTAKSYAQQRSELYDELAADLERKGPAFLNSGGTSQSLKLSDLFHIRDGKVEPVLRPADPPVRATVLHMDPEVGKLIYQILRDAVFHHFSEEAIWTQDPGLYHFSLHHASHHIEPVPATRAEVEAEADAVQAVAKRLGRMRIALRRVVLTSTGVLLGLWDVLEGPDPAVIRLELSKALPFAPKRQLYDSVLLHSSFARVLGLPSRTSNAAEAVPFLQAITNEATDKLAGWEVELTELWFVEELDVLALALNGRIVSHKFFLP